MRPYVEPVWGWDEDIQSQGFDEQLGAVNFKILTLGRVDIGGYCLKRRDDCYWLDMILLDAKYQDQGMGKEMMEVVHSIAASLNLPVRLCSMKINPATQFYKHLGYKEYKSDDALSYLEFNHEVVEV